MSPPDGRGEDGARADFYALVARLLSAPPDPALLDAMASAGALEAAPDSPLAAAWAQLRDAAGAGDTVRLGEEFERLFVGVGKPEVLAYGSYYLTGFLMEKPLAQLREDLQRLGFARRAGIAESEDHLAALAEVMRMLIGDPGLGEDTQTRFFARHLEPWYGRFCDALEEAAGTDFYAAVARFVRAFLDVEKASFAIEA